MISDQVTSRKLEAEWAGGQWLHSRGAKLNVWLEWRGTKGVKIQTGAAVPRALQAARLAPCCACSLSASWLTGQFCPQPE